MPLQPSIRALELAVMFLGVFALGLAAVVYLLMEFRHRRQIAMETRRLILSNKLGPFPSAARLQVLWLRSGRRDREIIEELLADLCKLAADLNESSLERSILESGIFDRWLKQLKAGSQSRRVQSALRLGFIRETRGVFALAEAAKDPSPEVRLAVALSLGRLKNPQGLPGLFRVMKTPGPLIPDLTLAAALAACAESCPSRLVGLLQANEVRQRVIGAWALSQVADGTVLRYLLAAARDPEPEVRAKVARALARIPSANSDSALLRLAKDPVWFVRLRALDALGKLQSPPGEAAAVDGLVDQALEVRSRAAAALRQIRGMQVSLAAKILATRPWLSFESLVSEWERAGFLWQVVAGLSPRDFPHFAECQAILKALIEYRVVRALSHFVLVFPDLKVRLRLVRLFGEVASSGVRAELLALAELPRCDRRVAAAIRKAFPDVNYRRRQSVITSPA